jgi:serine/threonine protein kinase
MATVYLAHDLKHGRQVALKVLKPEVTAALGPQRFLNEIQVTANLQHPHILPLYDSGNADGMLFYVMPLVRGESLRQRIEREKLLPVDEAITIARQVASALDFAHRQGVIHRDIKPENILLQEGDALLADFGIALALSEAAGGRLTGTGVSIGTIEYMSPEQAGGERDVDARSDVYALGAGDLRDAHGHPPVTGSTAVAIIAKLLTEPPPPLRSVRGDVPRAVDACSNAGAGEGPRRPVRECTEVRRWVDRPGAIGDAGDRDRQQACHSSDPPAPHRPTCRTRPARRGGRLVGSWRGAVPTIRIRFRPRRRRRGHPLDCGASARQLLGRLDAELLRRRDD